MQIKRTTILLPFVLFAFLILAGFTIKQQLINSTEVYSLDGNKTVWDLYEKLGKIKINEVNRSIKGVSAEKGKDLVFNGASLKQNNKGRTSIQSPYFKCTACHNNQKELDDLTNIASNERLSYAIENNLPFLQGTTFYGLINRKTYYNDDYQKKYGHIPIIKASNTDIRKAIQLCATQCAQGRALEDWEIESILAYFWTIGLSLDDLKLSKSDQNTVETAIQQQKNTSEAIQIIDGAFLDRSPAHFAEDKKFEEIDEAVLNDKQRFENGAQIYDKSCLHCHKNERYSFFNLDKGRFSFKNLMQRTKAGGMGSLHKITRHGTWPLAGKKAYMPLYPLEKLSEEQLTDLRIYVENMASGKNLSK